MKIVMIGIGKTGINLLGKFSNRKDDVTIIDKNREKIAHLIEKYDVSGIVGNGASKDVQMEAGVQDADCVIILTCSDELNLLACLVARKLGATNMIVRISNPEYINQMTEMKAELGISMLIHPEKETAKEMSRLICEKEHLYKNVMIIGGGLTGYYLADELSQNRYIVKMLEYDENRAEEMAEALPKVNVIHADGTKPYILQGERIQDTDVFVALTGVDEDNIIVSMYAEQQRIKKIITKLDKKELIYISEQVGIHDNVSPKDITAEIVLRYIENDVRE